MGLNLFVFVVAIVFVEPWKRRRLGETFEQRMVVLERENQAIMRDGMEKIEVHFQQQEEVLTKLAAASMPFEAPSGSAPVDHTLPQSAPVVDEEPPPDPSPPQPSIPTTLEPYFTYLKSITPTILQNDKVLSLIGGLALSALLSSLRADR